MPRLELKDALQQAQTLLPHGVHKVGCFPLTVILTVQAVLFEHLKHEDQDGFEMRAAQLLDHVGNAALVRHEPYQVVE